jgi:hypothetical protein
MNKTILIILLSFYLGCTNDHKDPGSKAEFQDSLSRLNYASDFDQYIKKLYNDNNEPSLVNYNKDCFRIFIWRFNKPFVTVVRIEKDSNDKINLTAKEIISPSRVYNSKTDTLVNLIHKEISLSSWDSIIELSNQAYFWLMEEKEYPPNTSSDGSTWLIEGSRIPNTETKPFEPFCKYKAIYRRCPYKGSYYSLGEKIIVLSGLIKKEDLH